MKRLLFAACACLAFFLAGCGPAVAPSSVPAASSLSDPAPAASASVPASTVTEAAAQARAEACYPEGIALEYDGTGTVEETECHLFSAVRQADNLLVSRAAVACTGDGLWFLDMSQQPEDRWLTAEFMGMEGGYTEPDAPEPSPYAEYSIGEGDDGLCEVLYLHDTALVPELSARNEVRLAWYPDSRQLDLVAAKITGTTTGAPEGPSLRLLADYAQNPPVLIKAEFHPAPMYSSPLLVLRSGEALAIEQTRLWEICDILLAELEIQREAE